MRLPLGELTFDVRTAGPDDGPLVVLLHGFPQTSHCWWAQLEALGAAGYRVRAPDQRGYSPDARPTDLAAYHSERLSEDVLGLADHEGADTFHVVGHDWGASVAWQLAGRHGDRLASMTAVSVPHPLAFSSALASPDSDQASRSTYFDLFRADDAADGLLANDATGLRMIYAASGLTEEEAAPYLEHLRQPGALAAALNWYRAAGAHLISGLGPVTVPTLHVWSTDDPALGREGAEATADHVDGPYRLAVLAGVDHWIPEHAPDELNHLLLEHLGTV